MFEQADRQQQRTIALAASQSSAELVVTSLAAHGVRAALTAIDRAYPSINWAQGYRVVVAADEEQEARRILAALSGDDVVEVAGQGDEE